MQIKKKKKKTCSHPDKKWKCREKILEQEDSLSR
jgi:hypothetical protein